jgi:hypothetical protein
MYFFIWGFLDVGLLTLCINKKVRQGASIRGENLERPFYFAPTPLLPLVLRGWA